MLCVSESDSFAPLFGSYIGRIWFEIGTTSSYNTDIWITFLLYKRYVTKALDILTSLEIIV